jgi:DNA-binding transcriptional ArsR family regulator
MQAKQLGPVTEAMFLKAAGQFVCLWAGVIRREKGQLGWGCLSTRLGGRRPARAAAQEMSAAAVERLLSPLAHEGRVRIMQALFQRTLTASALSRATGFGGGGLYHHLRELEHADYVVSDRGKYRLTQLGCELLVTVLSMANEVIEDRGKRGLGVGTHWQEHPK